MKKPIISDQQGPGAMSEKSFKTTKSGGSSGSKPEPKETYIPTSQMTSKADVLNFKRRMIHSSETLYPICCAAMSPSGAFLGLGLADGTVLVWDNLVNSERAYLDKHKLDVEIKLKIKIF